MNNFLRILILYKIRELKPFICLSNFLKLCGFIVEEKIFESDNAILTEDFRQFTCAVALTNNDLETHIKSNFFYINPYSNQEDDQKVCKNTVISTLEQIKIRKILSTDICECLLRIAEVYRENNLRIYEYNSFHFFYDEGIMSETYSAYQSAEIQLFDLFKRMYVEDKAEVLPFVQYARCYSICRMHEIEKRFCKEEKYDIEKVMNTLEELVISHNEIISIYCLMGQICEAQRSWNKAYEYYSCFLKIIDKGSFASNIWYRIGKVVEEGQNLRNAQEYYQRAYLENNQNYQAEYKLLVYEEFSAKKYWEAVIGYQKLIKKYEDIMKEGNLQPKELEYLFKFYFRCGRLYLRKLFDMNKAKMYFEKEEELARVSINEMIFFTKFYGKEAEDYLRKTTGRFPMYQIRINKQEAEWNQNL